MSIRTKYLPALGFIVSALAIGVPYWLLPYREVNLPSALYGPGLWLLMAAAALTLACAATTFWKGVAIVGAAALGVVIVRVAFETLADPTSHNLWPFELVIAGTVGFVCALAGGITGWAIQKLRGPRGTIAS